MPNCRNRILQGEFWYLNDYVTSCMGHIWDKPISRKTKILKGLEEQAFLHILGTCGEGEMQCQIKTTYCLKSNKFIALKFKMGQGASFKGNPRRWELFIYGGKTEMGGSLLNGGIHKCETCGVKYKYCDFFLTGCMNYQLVMPVLPISNDDVLLPIENISRILVYKRYL